MRSNLDVWAIQYYPDELATALKQIREGFNIVYSNCVCDIRIGSQEITTRQFDTFLYNEESEVLIMLMRGGKASKEDIIKYLEANNKPYGEVTFAHLKDEFQDGDDLPELWFAREEYVLKDALDDSKSKGVTSCIYYPLAFGQMDLGYLTSSDKKVNVDGRLFGGVVQLDDKVVLIIEQENNVDSKGNNRNMTPKKVLGLLERMDVQCEVSYDDSPYLFVEKFSEKQKTLGKVS
jgi:hypothetical protein